MLADWAAKTGVSSVPAITGTRTVGTADFPNQNNFLFSLLNPLGVHCSITTVLRVLVSIICKSQALNTYIGVFYFFILRA